MLLGLATAALAWPVAEFYAEPALLWLMPVVGLTSVLQGFYSTAMPVAQRLLDMRAYMLIQVATQVLQVAFVVTWAYLRPGVWALAWGMVFANMVTLILSHSALPQHRHRLAWDRAAVRQVLTVGIWLVPATFFAFLASQSDRLILARLLSTHDFGLYSIAIGLVQLPLGVVLTLGGNVLFPFLAEQARNDRARFAASLASVRRTLLAVGVAATACLFLVAPAFFALLYPAEYHAAGWLTQLLCAVLWFSLLLALGDNALLATGDTQSLMIVNLTRFVASVALCLAGFYVFGGTGPAAAAGFIGGLALGHALAYVLESLLLLRRHAVSSWPSDLARTAALVALAGVGLVAQMLISQGNHVQVIPALLCAAAVVAWLAAVELFRALKPRNPDPNEPGQPDQRNKVAAP